MSPAQPWWDYRSFYTRADLKLAAVAAISACSALLWVPVPLVVRDLFDTAVPIGDTRSILRAGLMLAALVTASELLALSRRRIAIRETQMATATIRRAVVDRIHSMGIEEHHQTEPEQLHELVVTAPERIDSMAYAMVATLLPAMVLGLGIVVVLATIDLVLTTEIAALIALLVVADRLIRPHIRDHEHRFAAASSSFDDSVTFSLRSLELTRIQGLETQDVAHLEREARVLRAADSAMQVAQGNYRTLVRITLAIAAIVVLVTGSTIAARGELSVGDLFAFYAALVILIPPLALSFVSLPVIRRGHAALRDVMHLLAAGPVAPGAGMLVLDDPAPIELNGVFFSYGPEPLLEDVTLNLRQGELTLISGPNGSGKSSLISLILGLYQPDRGYLAAAGHRYRELDLPALRRAIGVVGQEAAIVAGTVAANIKFGLPDAGDVEMWQAAHLATVDDFIIDFENGYDQQLAFEGRTLSAGQRQRIAIARALIRTPRVLILDEPGSYLDGGTLRRIINNLNRLPLAPAVLITSHHPRFVDRVDHLYRIEGRRLVPYGPAATAGETAVPSG